MPVGRLEAVGGHDIGQQHAGEHTDGMDATHLDACSIGQYRHPHRIRTPAADHHLGCSITVTVLVKVRAQNLVWVLMIARDEPLEIFLT
jgi:hypothetical protein